MADLRIVVELTLTITLWHLQLMEERPMWSRMALMNQLDAEDARKLYKCALEPCFWLLQDVTNQRRFSLRLKYSFERAARRRQLLLRRRSLPGSAHSPRL